MGQSELMAHYTYTLVHGDPQALVPAFRLYSIRCQIPIFD
jgi:hypothetical protein